jgi:hypothetical protein
MRTETRTERIGEYLGPVDWSYDFTSHDWSEGHGGVNPACTRQATLELRKLVELFDQGKTCMVSLYGEGHRVLQVGMYDGWPFWKPTPSVLVSTWLGSEWHPWYQIRNVCEAEAKG